MGKERELVSGEVISTGCYVTIGDNSLTWEVIGMPDLGPKYGSWVTLKSGQSARRRQELVGNLRYHSAARK